MKTILFIDRKWQSSVTACVRVHYEDGSLRHYLQGRYGVSALPEIHYDGAQPYRVGAWKRYWHLPGKQGLKVEVLGFETFNAQRNDSGAIRKRYQSQQKIFSQLRLLPSPVGLIELKFETVFAGAKDSQAGQTKAQFFVDRGGLRDTLESLSCLSNDYGRC